MAAIRDQLMWQPAGPEAAARVYASSAVEGIPSAARADAAPAAAACRSGPGAATGLAICDAEPTATGRAADADADPVLGPASENGVAELVDTAGVVGAAADHVRLGCEPATRAAV